MATGTIKKITTYAEISTNNTMLVNVEITNNTASNPYTAPRDGYVLASAQNNGSYGIVSLYGSAAQLVAAPNQWGMIFVKKGARIAIGANISRAFFRAFW